MRSDALSAAMQADLQCRSLELANTLHRDWYCSEEVFHWEAQKLLPDSWQPLSFSNPSTKVQLDRLFGHNLIISDTGNLQIFSAACRHLCGPVRPVDNSHQTRLRCGYHGWEYDLDGQLINARDFGCPKGFREEAVRLAEFASQKLFSLSLCALNRPGKTEPLVGFEELVADLRSCWTEHAGKPDRESYTVACNWKLYVENYLEGYHLGDVHPGLSQQLDAAEYTGQIRQYGSVQVSPFADEIMGSGRAVYAFVYPNWMVNVIPGRIQVNRVEPRGLDTCRVIFETVYAANVSDKQRQYDQQSAHQTQLEDIAICEAIQQNYASGAYTRGRVSPKWESPLHDFQNRYRQDAAREIHA